MPHSPGTETRTRAGIELAGRMLRYAEVEAAPSIGPEPGVARMLRMGWCDFDFDVGRAILGPGGAAQRETVARAVAEIFGGSQASQLLVVVHPWASTSFFTPLPAGATAAEKVKHLRQEAAMLADVRAPRPLQVSATAVRSEKLADGREYHWHHVLHLPEPVHGRAAHLAEQLGPRVGHAFVDAAGAAIEVAARLRRLEDPGDDLSELTSNRFALLAGVYDKRVEVSLMRGTTWHFSSWVTAQEATDAVYHSAVLLQHLGIDVGSVGDLFVYGLLDADAVVGAFEELLAREARPLNPLPLFPSLRSQTDAQTLAAFAPCVGAALR